MARARTKPQHNTPPRGPRNLPHLAGRLFGTPLLVDARKLDQIVPVFLRRMNGEIGDDELSPDDHHEADEPNVDAAAGIAVIPIIGSLVRRPSMLEAWSGLTSYNDIAASLQCALDDARVRGILLQVDSFGGEAGGCFELCDKIYNARSLKPIWAVADIEALSAGYAILSSAERCYVAGRGHAGSIGVVTVHMERSIQNEMMGVTYTVLTAGERKGDFNPFEKLAPEAAAQQLEYIERTRQTFAETVARNRGLNVNDVLATEGQFFDAQDSLSRKLVDGIETYESVFTLLTAAVPAPTRASIASAPRPDPQTPVDADDKDDDPDAKDLPDEDAMDPKVAENATAAPAATTTAAAPAAPAVPDVAAAAAAQAGNVVNLETAKPADAAREIAELCTIAGRPELCATFIGEGLSVGDVRKRLINARASASGAGDTAGEVSNHQPARAGGPATLAPVAGGAASPDALASWGKAFAKVHAGDARFAGAK